MAEVKSSFYKDWQFAKTGIPFEATYTADQVLDDTVENVKVDTTSNTVQITLPNSALSTVGDGKKIWIADQGNASTNNITIIPNPADSTTINRLSSFIITTDNGAAIFELLDGDWIVSTDKNLLAEKTVSTTYQVLDSDELVIGDTTGGAFTITLTTAVGKKGRTIDIKKLFGAAPLLTIAAFAGEFIDTVATQLLVGALGPSLTLTSDGVGWVIR